MRRAESEEEEEEVAAAITGRGGGETTTDNESQGSTPEAMERGGGRVPEPEATAPSSLIPPAGAPAKEAQEGPSKIGLN